MSLFPKEARMIPLVFCKKSVTCKLVPGLAHSGNPKEKGVNGREEAVLVSRWLNVVRVMFY